MPLLQSPGVAAAWNLIGGGASAGNPIGDRLLDWTASLNSSLFPHSSAANALLIVSSGIIDLLGIFLLARWIFRASTRPLVGLLIIIVLGLRQVAQALVSLPYDDGVPSTSIK